MKNALNHPHLFQAVTKFQIIFPKELSGKLATKRYGFSFSGIVCPMNEPAQEFFGPVRP
jgi:hypothetical protein